MNSDQQNSEQKDETTQPGTTSKIPKSTWTPSGEKETYNTVVLNYRYVKSKNQQNCKSKMRSHKSPGKSLPTSSTSSSNNSYENVPNLRKLFLVTNDDANIPAVNQKIKIKEIHKISRSELPLKPVPEIVHMDVSTLPTVQNDPSKEREELTVEPTDKTDFIDNNDVIVISDDDDDDQEGAIGCTCSGYETNNNSNDEGQQDSHNDDQEDAAANGDANKTEINTKATQNPDNLDKSINVVISDDDDDQEGAIGCTCSGYETNNNSNDEGQQDSQDDDQEDAAANGDANKTDINTKATQNPDNLDKPLTAPDTADKITNTSLFSLKLETSTTKQRQIELHQHRVAVEQKRLELIELKIQREKEEILHCKKLFEKQLETTASQNRLDEDTD